MSFCSVKDKKENKVSLALEAYNLFDVILLRLFTIQNQSQNIHALCMRCYDMLIKIVVRQKYIHVSCFINYFLVPVQID